MKRFHPCFFLVFILIPGLCWAESFPIQPEVVITPPPPQNTEVINSPEVLEVERDIDSSDVTGLPANPGNDLLDPRANVQEQGDESSGSSSGCAMNARANTGALGLSVLFLILGWCFRKGPERLDLRP